MRKIIFLIVIIFYSYPSLAEIVTGEGEYTHTEDVSVSEGCMIAKQKAKLDATQKVSGQTISSEELEKCTEIDGVSNCHRNHFFLSSFNADITGLQEIGKPKKTNETLSNGETVYICNTKIEADVVPINQITDPNFDFNVNFNRYNFESRDNLEIEIGITKPMYLNIFQLLPYLDPKDYQAKKLFPNKLETNNYLKSNKTKLPTNGMYRVQIPKNIDKKNVVDYLVFIASKEKIEFLNEYTTINDLKKSYLGLKNKVKFKYQQYTIVK